MSSWCPSRCVAEAQEVQVSYVGQDFNGDHVFNVSSLSRPVTHMVTIRLKNTYNNFSHLTPKEMIDKRVLRIDSTDESFRYLGCKYNLTMMECSIFPEFRAPKTPQHDYVVTHTTLAVLSLLSTLGPGELKSSFSKVMKFNEAKEVYECVSKPSLDVIEYK